MPDILQEEATRIRGLDVDHQEILFDRNSWRKHIPDLDDLLAGIPGDLISRHTMYGIAPNDPPLPAPCTPARQADLRRFFILVMIWGYGNVGTGPWRVSQMIASPRFPEILCRVSEECFCGFFLKAYDTLISNIKWLGPAFASKYLYYFCRKVPAHVKPLICDRVVLRAMRTFDWPAWCVNYIADGNTPRRQAHAYGQYLILMHNWAHALGCRPDQLEYFLWRRGTEAI
ncbi:MAG: hypothetical protein K9N49_00605 [Candidatus Marinimicrobia bacterium]|nr:hypothetical protein [Candidatus Neomarinimicrobiota bacterium]